MLSSYPLEAKFREFNDKFFFNEIFPNTQLSFQTYQNNFGVTRIETHKFEEFGRVVHLPATLKIMISPTYPKSELEFDQVLLHEMVHAWLVCHGYFNHTHEHRLFVWKLDELKRRFGHPIPIVFQLN